MSGDIGSSSQQDSSGLSNSQFFNDWLRRKHRALDRECDQTKEYISDMQQAELIGMETFIEAVDHNHLELSKKKKAADVFAALSFLQFYLQQKKKRENQGDKP